jgi:hypothetical protein
MNMRPKRKMTNLRQTILDEGGEEVDITHEEWRHICGCFPKWLTTEQLSLIYHQFEDQRCDGSGGLFYHYLIKKGRPLILHRV